VFVRGKYTKQRFIGKPLQKVELELKHWDENDVEMEVTHCGICGSDTHTIDETWGPSEWPCVVGHEIAGVVTRVGKNVTTLKIGDRAGVGGQSGCCHECKQCKKGNEQLCSENIFTFGRRHPNGDKTYGGFASKWRGDYRFAHKLPENLTNEQACTFLCGGITTYAPLKRCNVDSSSVVGVMGIGGLGHFGILFAKAMGAKVIGMSQSDKKKEVALELGCDEYINYNDPAQMAKYERQLTHILATGSGPDFEWAPFLNLLEPEGHFINVMLQDFDLPKLAPMLIIFKQLHIHGSLIGSPQEIRDMLALASEKNIKPWFEVRPFDDVEKVLDDFRAGKPRFRYVLKN
jgi:D-arabinose 1-dehydrogenase-like Zn-dependent alcohol dehydrogenase